MLPEEFKNVFDDISKETFEVNCEEPKILNAPY